ncbi:MAG: hypothetical protein HYV07_01955 [Deltaproteobacteria bacterium]|nr:hypothetical protein [Deltaproteobacteria bacterium]
MKVRPSERRLSFQTGTRTVELDFRVRLIAVTDNSTSDEPTTARSFSFESVAKVVVRPNDAPEIVLILDQGEAVSLGVVGQRDRALRAAWALGNSLRCVIEQESDEAWPGGPISERDLEEETDKFELEHPNYDDEPTTRMQDELLVTLTNSERAIHSSNVEAALRGQSGLSKVRAEGDTPVAKVARIDLPEGSPIAWIDALAPAPLDLSSLASAELVVDERKRSTWVVRTKRGDRVTIPFTEADVAARRGSAITKPEDPVTPPFAARVVAPLSRRASEIEATEPPELEVTDPVDISFGEDTGR